MLKPKAPSKNFKKHMKELENLSKRINAKMMKLEKIINDITNNLS